MKQILLFLLIVILFISNLTAQNEQLERIQLSLPQSQGSYSEPIHSANTAQCSISHGKEIEPKSYREDWPLSWCTHTIKSYLGGGVQTNCKVAVRFTPVDLTEKGVSSGDTLTKFKFIANNDDNRITSLTIEIFQGSVILSNPGTLKYQQSVPLSSILSKEWTEIDLTTPVVIDNSLELWLSYHVESLNPVYPVANHTAGFDASPHIENKGNLLLWSGTQWTTLWDLGGGNSNWDGNWLIEGFVTPAVPCDPIANLSLEKPSESSVLLIWSEPKSDIDGYLIYRNNILLTEELVTTNSYLDENLLNGIYEYYVITHYSNGCVSDSSNHVKAEFNIGINEVEESDVVLYQNPATEKLQITSSKLLINNIDVFDVYGRNLLSSHLIIPSSHYQIDISHLQYGIYFVKITTQKGVIIKKITKSL